jgi:hypothetical protein
VLLCLLILVGAQIAVPTFSLANEKTYQQICDDLKKQQVDSKISPRLLPIQRQRLSTITNEGGGKVTSEQIDFVDVTTSDLFAVPPSSPLFVSNPPYPYQYKQACWGDVLLNLTPDSSSERTIIMMPDPEQLKQVKSKFWHRSENLLVIAKLPSPIVGNSSPSETTYNPGERVDIRLNVPTPTTTAKNTEDSGSPLESKFQWSLATPPADPKASPLLSPIAGKFTRLTLPPSTDKTEEIRINIEYENENLGSILFEKKQGESKWTNRESGSKPTSLYFWRDNLQVSSRRVSRFSAIIAALLAYIGISYSVYLFNTRTGEGLLGFKNWKSWKGADWKRTLTYLNPVVMTAGPYGKASLSKLQLLWFTIIILSVLVYLLNLTGDLSDLPGSVLILLGISATGTIGAGLASNNKSRLSFVNWQWLNDQGWLSEDDQYGNPDAKSKQAENYGSQSRWRDLLLDEKGVVNVYKFQLLFTSLLVGVFLILSGGSNLRGFRLPENFPQLLGISNIFYVTGRSFQPTGFDELDTKITALIAKEKDLKKSVSDSPDPKQRPEPLDDYLLEAKLAAGMTKVVYSDLAVTKFDHNSPILDNELLPPWAQKYGTDWLK